MHAIQQLNWPCMLKFVPAVTPPALLLLLLCICETVCTACSLTCRTHEYEADMIGLYLMAQACFDPIAMPSMLEKLGKRVSALMHALLYAH